MRGLSEMFNVNYFLVSQANPHVVPILYLKSKLNSVFADVMEQEWKHRCVQLQSLLPAWFPSKVLTLVSQTWEGDVTVVLPYEYCQVGKAIINPTPASLLEAIHAGERCTWEKLAAIQCNCSIEMTLDQCLNIVVASERARRRAAAQAMACNAVVGPAGNRAGSYSGSLASKTRIPSWLAMSTMGDDGKTSSENLVAAGECGSPHSEAGAQEGGSVGWSENLQQGGSSPIAIPPGNKSADGRLDANVAHSSENLCEGLPCSDGADMMADFPLFTGHKTPEQAPFGSYSSAQEFWSRLFPVAAIVDESDMQALDFIAP